MIRGVQITMRGEELSRRIADRIRLHEATLSALDVRIKKREDDQPFDVRAEDGFQTLGELEQERQHYRDRVSQLTLLRDGINAGELYALSRGDLRLTELISPDFTDAAGVPDDKWNGSATNSAIDGLKLTISGEEVRRLLEQRMREHRRRAARWKREETRTLEEQTEDEPLLPEHMCANEAERHEWRADVLGFIHGHIDCAEVYRLGEADLVFGELLPEKPGWMEQAEYEERTSVGFNLERLTKSVGNLMPAYSFPTPETQKE